MGFFVSLGAWALAGGGGWWCSVVVVGPVGAGPFFLVSLALWVGGGFVVVGWCGVGGGRWWVVGGGGGPGGRWVFSTLGLRWARCVLSLDPYGRGLNPESPKPQTKNERTAEAIAYQVMGSWVPRPTFTLSNITHHYDWGRHSENG